MKKILVVDDDPKILMVLQMRLGASGYEVSTASDGKQAVDVALEAPPDLVLLDIAMPVGNGLMVAEKFRQSDSLVDIPIIFMTAMRNVDLAKKALAWNSTSYLEKPFTTEELLKQIEDQLNTEPA